jgi:hypothetical protein
MSIAKFNVFKLTYGEIDGTYHVDKANLWPAKRANVLKAISEYRGKIYSGLTVDNLTINIVANDGASNFAFVPLNKATGEFCCIGVLTDSKRQPFNLVFTPAPSTAYAVELNIDGEKAAHLVRRKRVLEKIDTGSHRFCLMATSSDTAMYTSLSNKLFDSTLTFRNPSFMEMSIHTAVNTPKYDDIECDCEDATAPPLCEYVEKLETGRLVTGMRSDQTFTLNTDYRIDRLITKLIIYFAVY